ncbi:transcriptional regulator [Actinokineospora sp. NBRC 105648]|nr:transcriptional regulator [Actinokineospora sp. NBRC 105648]
MAGISKGYLSMLERGQRGFERRGLLEDLATALGCAVADLTGQPYPPGDRASAELLCALPDISLALYDSTLDDAADLRPRPLAELVRWARLANEHTAHSRYSHAARQMGALLAELHVWVATGTAAERRTALAGVVEAGFAASAVARTVGNGDLAIVASRRAEDAAARIGDPGLVGFAAMCSTSALSRLGARHRARQVAARALAQTDSIADPWAADTSVAEAAGMLHLCSAQLAAKENRPVEARTHLAEARALAERTGERNRLWFSFGPANVRAWTLSVEVELGAGPAMAERVDRTPGYTDQLPTADRRAALHFDLARAHAQAGGSGDARAIHHLDAADRTAPERVRHDPIARELLRELDGRATVRTWALDSLGNRIGN